MAEAALRELLKKHRPGRVEVLSAGTGAATGFPATMYATEVVGMWNADLSHHQSQQLKRSLIERADLVFGMTSEHVKEILRLAPNARDKTYLFKNFPDHSARGEGVDDPIGQGLDKYNEIFLEIGEYLGKHLPLIVQMIDEKQATN